MDAARRKTVRLRPRAGKTARHRLAVFTSVDGTLLDARTFDGPESQRAAHRLAAADIPVIPVSVMTLEELEPIADAFRLRHAMVVEAGGGIARWLGNRWEVESCGPPAETLLDVIGELEDRSGARLLIYSALSSTEASHLSGRTGPMLHASMRRHFSEPFVIEDGDPRQVFAAAAAMGFSVRKGRRFLHLCRDFDKGEAFTRVREELGCETAIAVGGAAIDAEFLSRADISIVIPGPDGLLDRDLIAAVPAARIAASPGPAGWATAIEQVWRDLTVAARRHNS